MTTNYYFGTFDFPPQTEFSHFPDESFEDDGDLRRKYFWEYVNQSEVVHAESDEPAVWRFGDCQMVNDDIYGKFGRNFIETQTTWDPDIEDYRIEDEEIEVAEVSHFVIFPDIPGIAFNRKNRIGPSQFEEAFVGGYNQEFNGEPIEMELLRTGGEYTYPELIDVADNILKLDFNLEPTNPYPDDEMRLLDEHIRGMDADSYNMTAQVDDEDSALNPREDLLKSAGAMADGPYGFFTAKYRTSEGETESYNSKGTYETEELPEPEELDGIIDYGEELYELLRDIVSGDGNQQSGSSRDGPAVPEDQESLEEFEDDSQQEE